MELRINIEPVQANSTGFDFLGRPVTIRDVHRTFANCNNRRFVSDCEYFLEAQKIRGSTEITTLVGNRTKPKTTKTHYPTRWVYKVYRVDRAIIDLLKSNGKKIVQKKVNHTHFYDIVDCKRG